MGVARAVRGTRRSPLLVLSGVLAGGLVVLAVALGVAWVVATRTGSPGPAGSFLAWHALAAVVAVVAQVRADRGASTAGGPIVASLVVVAVAVLVLAALWLA